MADQIDTVLVLEAKVAQLERERLSTYPRSLYVRAPLSGGPVGAGGPADFIVTTFPAASGRPILWTFQCTVTVTAGNGLRTWMNVNGVDLPGRLWYLDMAATAAFTGSIWQAAPPQGDLAVKVRWQSNLGWTYYNDATTLGDSNVTYLLGVEY